MRETPQITRLERERLRRDLSYGELGELFGVGEAAAWRYCTAPDHPLHRAPARKPRKPQTVAPSELMRRWSGGKCHLGNFADLVAAPVRRAVKIGQRR